MKKIIPGNKDATGAYVKQDLPPPAPDVNAPAPTFLSQDIDLASLLEGQILALARTTQHLLVKSTTAMNKDDIASLATLIKITMELRLKEKELLDKLEDDALDALSRPKSP